jgi:manganese/iron transport system substrate-binding protein
VNLERVLQSAGGRAAQVELAQGLELRTIQEGDASHQEGEPVHGELDPHVWFDVQNVIHWAEAIQDTLRALDPDNATYYAGNAQQYIQQLQDLDQWVQEQIAQIPEGNRKLVTNHPVFGYLADRYGLEQLGAVYPISSSSEPSAQDIAALEDAIRDYEVPAVFTESTVSRKLAEQVATDTGVRLVPLFTGSLSEPGEGAESYVMLIRYDVGAIVEALE